VPDKTYGRLQTIFCARRHLFFTLVTLGRRKIFADAKALELLGNCMCECNQHWPFKTIAMVALHDHLHAIWSLPRGDNRYSARWGWIKKEFSKRWRDLDKRILPVSRASRKEQRLGVWQRRFWEHTIRDETDFDRHFDYVHYNPVKHGYVACAKDWPSSTFHRWVEAGVYNLNWGCGHVYQPDFQAIADSVGE
jgi:putative transposase